MLAVFYTLAVALMAVAGWGAGAGIVFSLGLVAFAAQLSWQISRLDIGDPDLCLRLFKSNRDAGLILFARDGARRAGAVASHQWARNSPGTEGMDSAFYWVRPVISRRTIAA